jgi:PAS domain S-box-containing protein
LATISAGLARAIERQRAEEALRHAYRGLEDQVEQRTWALALSEERLEMAMEGAELGLWDWDVQADRISYNRRWEEALGYSTQELEPGSHAWSKLLHPDDLDQALDALQASLDNPATLFENEHRLRTKSGGWMWVLARGKVVERDAEGKPLRHAGTLVDITQRKEAEAALRRRTEDLTALHKATQGFLGELSVQATLDRACLQAVEQFGCTMAWVGLIDPEDVLPEAGQRVRDRARSREVVPASACGLEEGYLEAIRVTWDESPTGRGPTGAAIRSRQAVAMNQIDSDPAYAPWREAALARGYRSSAAFPLLHAGRVLGVLNVYSVEAGHYDPDRMLVLQAYANLVAAALEEARLFEQVERQTVEMERRIAERTRELAVLYEVAALSGESVDLETTLSRALAQVLDILRYETGLIHLVHPAPPVGTDAGSSPARSRRDGASALDATPGGLRLAVQQGFSDLAAAQVGALPVQRGLGARVVEEGRPTIVPDLAQERALSLPEPAEPRAYLGIPLRVGGQTLGVLSIFGPVDRLPLSVEELSLLTSVGDQLGTLVERARLRAEAERAAVSAERERLARDLHDSVTQLLYTVSLFSATGKQALASDDRGLLAHALDQLGVASQRALREMRLLLYELQVPRLVQMGLIGALRQRLKAVEERVGMEASLAGEPAIKWPVRVEQELYYLALEALNNALRHAHASEVAVHVAAREGQAELRVCDNGTGFDPDGVDDRGGLGLASMRQRAARLGGTIEIVSSPEGGTSIVARVPVER